MLLKRKSIAQRMSQVLNKEIVPEWLKTKRQKMIYQRYMKEVGIKILIIDTNRFLRKKISKETEEICYTL